MKTTIDWWQEMKDATKDDFKEIIENLICLGALPEFIEKVKFSKTLSGAGYDERIFEQSLGKLHGQWNMLSKNETDIIETISRKFI
jgi:hypothetical protein